MAALNLSPSGNASKITTQIFRIFDSDGNDFLDFKEFLMAIDVANRTTGGWGNFHFNESSTKIAKFQMVAIKQLLSQRTFDHSCKMSQSKRKKEALKSAQSVP